MPWFRQAFQRQKGLLAFVINIHLQLSVVLTSRDRYSVLKDNISHFNFGKLDEFFLKIV